MFYLSKNNRKIPQTVNFFHDKYNKFIFLLKKLPMRRYFFKSIKIKSGYLSSDKCFTYTIITKRFLKLWIPSMINTTNLLFFLRNYPIRRYFLKMIFVVVTTSVLGCNRAVWKNHGDSCILISEKPPLRRIINYSDHELCGRKLSPRTPPNPLTRPQTK